MVQLKEKALEKGVAFIELFQFLHGTIKRRAARLITGALLISIPSWYN